MSSSVSGFDELSKALNKLSENAKKLEQTKSISFDKLFDTSFMRKHTQVSSFEEFLKAGNFVVNSKEDFEAIPDDVFDAYVVKATSFSSWKEMQEIAVKDYLAEQLGF